MQVSADKDFNLRQTIMNCKCHFLSWNNFWKHIKFRPSFLRGYLGLLFISFTLGIWWTVFTFENWVNFFLGLFLWTAMGAASTLVKAICFVATPKGSMSLHWKNDRLGVGLGWDSRWPNKNRIRFSEDSHVFRSHICHFFVKIPWYIGWSLWWKTSDTGKMDGEYHLIKQKYQCTVERKTCLTKTMG